MSLLRTPRARPAVGAVIASLVLLGGCAQSEVKDSTEAQTDQSAIDEARSRIEGLAAPLTEYPAEPAISKPVSLEGKTVMVLPLGDSVPVIHGTAVGIQDGLEAAGASSKLCDGKFTPTVVADCLTQAVDGDVDAVVTLFIDYQAAAAAFDDVVAKGIPVLVGGVAAPEGTKSTDKLAFYDNTPRSRLLFEALSEAAIGLHGEDTDVLWLRLLDSTTTTGASDAGIERFEETCPDCGIATADFTTPNIDKMPSSVSAALVGNPDTNTVIVPTDSFVAPALQGIQAAGFDDKVDVVSGGSDLAGLQRVKDGQQAVDLGTPVIYEGWKYVNALMQMLAGDEVTKVEELVTRAFNEENVGELKLEDAAYFSADWFGDDSFKAAFLEAWGAN